MIERNGLEVRCLGWFRKVRFLENGQRFPLAVRLTCKNNKLLWEKMPQIILGQLAKKMLEDGQNLFKKAYDKLVS
jgi:hypothetical protein